jgi:hypothetical protein
VRIENRLWDGLGGLSDIRVTANINILVRVSFYLVPKPVFRMPSDIHMFGADVGSWLQVDYERVVCCRRE